VRSENRPSRKARSVTDYEYLSYASLVRMALAEDTTPPMKPFSAFKESSLTDTSYGEHDRTALLAFAFP
jgi:hypothetical protein